jgi:TonB family protein
MFLRAEIQVPGPSGAHSKGEYRFDWVSPTKWKEEIQFADYHRVRVGEPGGYWQQRNLGYEPEIIVHLDPLLHFAEAMRIQSKETLGKIKSHVKDGVQLSCLDVTFPNAADRTLCFETARGVLVSVEYHKRENRNPPLISRVEYGAFTAVGDKWLPYEIRASGGREARIGVKILGIANLSGENDLRFDPPSDAELWPQCDDMTEPELINHVHPVYPSGVRAKGEEGHVAIYAVVETNGSLSHLTVTNRAAKDLEVAAVQAVNQWRFKPAACGQTAVRKETIFTVDFRLDP